MDALNIQLVLATISAFVMKDGLEPIATLVSFDPSSLT